MAATALLFGSGIIKMPERASATWAPVVSQGTLTGTVQKASRHGLLWETREFEVAMSGLRRTNQTTKDGDSIQTLQLNLEYVSIPRGTPVGEADELEAALMKSLQSGRPVDIQVKTLLFVMPWEARSRRIVQSVSDVKP